MFLGHSLRFRSEWGLGTSGFPVNLQSFSLASATLLPAFPHLLSTVYPLPVAKSFENYCKCASESVLAGREGQRSLLGGQVALLHPQA